MKLNKSVFGKNYNILISGLSPWPASSSSSWQAAPRESPPSQQSSRYFSALSMIASFLCITACESPTGGSSLPLPSSPASGSPISCSLSPPSSLRSTSSWSKPLSCRLTTAPYCSSSWLSTPPCCSSRLTTPTCCTWLAPRFVASRWLARRPLPLPSSSVPPPLMYLLLGESLDASFWRSWQ